MSTLERARFTSINTKVLIALTLGLGLVLLSALGGLSFAWFSLSTAVPAEVERSQQGQALAQEFRLQVQEWKNLLIRGANPELRTKYLAAFQDDGKKVQSLAEQIAGASATAGHADAEKLARQFASEHRTLDQHYNATLGKFEASGYDTQAADLMVRGMDRPPTKTLDQLNELLEKQANTAVLANSNHARQMLLICAGLTIVIALALLAALATWLKRAIVKPVMELSLGAQRMARGELDGEIAANSHDEIGQLTHSMVSMQQQLRAVVKEQTHMAEQHQAGTVSYRMDESAFPGDYGRMVRGTNGLVASQLDTTAKIVALAQRYAVGDLSEDMPALPGEMQVISDTMWQIKSNLAAINSEIKRLAACAAAGDFSARGDEAAFQFDFQAMVVELNKLMATADFSLDALSHLLKTIAQGDLTVRMEGEFHGVFARMCEDANSTAEQLAQIIERIQSASGNINTAASEIATGNADLSVRTEQQAANLEETAASMEELTSTVKQNAESARQANQLAIGAAGVASKGGAVVDQVVTTMSDIQASSKKIAEIISVIDGIAFQTNILALNAAVEAARAGEQGRGFAVVASEVRMLAQRSAGAAKEIKTLIDDSVGKISHGTALVDQAGQTMGEIVAQVQRVTDIMSEISTASQEQSSGIEQVNLTITQMDEATQQNAALVEEATAAARSMEEQAEQLTEAVSLFKLPDQANASARAPTVVRPAPVLKPAFGG